MKKSLTLILLTSLLILPLLISPVSAQKYDQTIVSTELINFYSMTTTEITTFVTECKNIGMTMLTIRLNAMSEFQSGTSSGITKAKEIIQICNNNGIQVNIDLHTWYTTWDNYFDDDSSNEATYRSQYLTYITNVLNSFSTSNVYAFMVLNEPQAQTASTSENNFILNCISTAKSITSKPVSVRFMCGYSPSTGHYSPSIDIASDFLARNTYWDPRYPSTTVYGTTEAKINTAILTAHNQNKGIWFTEFGKTNSNTETQRAYVAAFVSWAKNADVDAIFCWVCQPDSSGETYNIFNGYTPLPAFYELSNTTVLPTSTPTPQPTVSPTQTPVPTQTFNPTSTPTQTNSPTSTPTPTPATFPQFESNHLSSILISAILVIITFFISSSGKKRSK